MPIGRRFRRQDETVRAWRASVGLLALLIATPGVARADGDLTNDWVATFRTDPPFLVEITCDLVFTQSGTELSADGTCREFCPNATCGDLPSATFSGTVDAETGIFELIGQVVLPSSEVPPEFATIHVSFDGAPVDAAHLEGSATIDGYPGTFDATLCGNGNLDAGEACDDGAATDGCCTASCTRKPDGVSCQSTAGCQIAPTCAAGACVGAPKPAGTQGETDGNRCTDDACDGAGACVAGPCSPCCGGEACTSQIRFGCVQPTDLRDVIDVQGTPLGVKPRDRISWRIPHLGATSADDLPDPETTDYAVCFYALDFREVFTLRFDSVARAGQGCGQNRCWKRTPKGGVSYNGGRLKPDGVAFLRVTPGPEGKARLAFAARGPNLDLAPVSGQELFPGGELLVQLRAGDACWSAGYGNAGIPPDIRTNTRYRKKGHEF